MTLTLTDVEKRYDEFTLGPIDLTVEDSVVAILGPSGSGKSTLLSVIAGFRTLDGGTIRLKDRRLDPLPPEQRRIGVVFQDYALFPHLSVAENLAFGADDRDVIDEMVTLVEIGDLLDRAPATLSGGEKQRVALARALASEPDVLLLDEPLSNLDAPIRKRLQLDLRRILSSLSIPVVYVTHDQDEAAVVADSLAVMDDGEIEQAGSIEAVFERPRTRFVAEFVGVENVVRGDLVGNEDDRLEVDVDGQQITATGTVAGPEVTVGVRPEAIDLAPPDADHGRSNALRCTVRRLVRQRIDVLVVLECSSGAPLVVRQRQRDLPPDLAPGSRVLATFDADHVVVIDS